MGARPVRKASILLIGLTSLIGLPLPVMAAEEVTVVDLIVEAEELAGAEIVVEGELVGDYGFRNDGWMWTQLNGDVYAEEPLRERGGPVGGNVGVGIRMPVELGEGLDPPGGYRNRGPIVRVSGVWKHHDPQRQGESYIEVASIEIIEPGRQLEEGIGLPTLVTGLALLAVAAAMWVTRKPE